MKNMPFPQTGISVVNENQENRNARVLSFAQAEAAAFDAYCAQLSAEGKRTHTNGFDPSGQHNLFQPREGKRFVTNVPHSIWRRERHLL